MEADGPCAAAGRGPGDASSLEGTVSAALRGDRTPDGALRAVVAAICADTGVDIAEAWMPRSDGVTLDRRAVHSVPAGSAGASPVSTYRGGGLAGIAWSDARAELRLAAGDSRHLRAESMRLGMGALDGAAALPIVFGSWAVGVITLLVQRDASELPADVDRVRAATEPLRHFVAAHVLAARLEESENRFHALADSSPTLIWAPRPNRSLEFANRSLLELAGMEEAELSLRWYQLIHADDREACERAWSPRLRRAHSSHSSRRRRRARASASRPSSASSPRTAGRSRSRAPRVGHGGHDRPPAVPRFSLRPYRGPQLRAPRSTCGPAPVRRDPRRRRPAGPSRSSG